MSGTDIFQHVCGQTIYTLAAIELPNTCIQSIAAKHDTFVLVVYDMFLSCYICNFKTNQTTHKTETTSITITCQLPKYDPT